MPGRQTTMGMWENGFIMGIRLDCRRSWRGSETSPAPAFQKNWCYGQVPPAGKSGKQTPTWVDRLEPGSEAGGAYGQLFSRLVVQEALVVGRLAGRKDREKARTSSLPSLTTAAARTLEGDAHCSTSTLQIKVTSLFLQTPTWDPAVKSGRPAQPDTRISTDPRRPFEQVSVLASFTRNYVSNIQPWCMLQELFVLIFA